MNTRITVMTGERPTLETAQHYVGGPVELIALPEHPWVQMLVHEEGRLRKLPINPEASTMACQTILGDALLLFDTARWLPEEIDTPEGVCWGLRALRVHIKRLAYANRNQAANGTSQRVRSYANGVADGLNTALRLIEDTDFAAYTGMVDTIELVKKALCIDNDEAYCLPRIQNALRMAYLEGRASVNYERNADIEVVTQQELKEKV